MVGADPVRWLEGTMGEASLFRSLWWKGPVHHYESGGSWMSSGEKHDTVELFLDHCQGICGPYYVG